MRKVTEAEMGALSQALQSETNSLALARATINLMGDEELRRLTETGMATTEARIKALQEFVNENNIVSVKEANQ